MSSAGESDCFHEDGFPSLLSPPPSRGSPAAAARRRCRRGGMIPTMFLAPEDAPWPWQTPWLSSRGWTPSFVGEDKVVATLVAAMSSRWRHARAGSGWNGESGRGEGEDAATRRWRCCRAVGGQRMTRREEWRRRGRREASWRRTTLREWGGGQREASGRRTTVQHNKRVGRTT